MAGNLSQRVKGVVREGGRGEGWVGEGDAGFTSEFHFEIENPRETKIRSASRDRDKGPSYPLYDAFSCVFQISSNKHI